MGREVPRSLTANGLCCIILRYCRAPGVAFYVMGLSGYWSAYGESVHSAQTLPDQIPTLYQYAPKPVATASEADETYQKTAIC